MRITPQEVDTLNVFQVRMEGFKRAIDILSKRTGANYAIIDGNFVPPNVFCESDYLVKGDEKLSCISAASILAKVTRDRLMLEQAKLYPEYGFEKHKGYLTKVHLDALKMHGPCEIHRLTYKPVKDSIK